MSFITANGVRTFYRVVGDGPPLLLIAGNGMDHTTFNEQLTSFANYFRCIVYDLRGIGQSHIPQSGYTTREMALDALSLLNELHIESAHIAGYSLGGAIAQEMALESPDRIKSLSLYSTFDYPDAYLRLRYELLVKILIEASPEIWAMFTAFSAFGQDYVNQNEKAIYEEIERRKKRWTTDTPPSKIGLMGHYQAILAHNTAKRISSINNPTWIAVGSQDSVTPVSYAQRLHESISGSELEVFPDRPHRILNFHAETFTTRALQFLLDHR